MGMRLQETTVPNGLMGYVLHSEGEGERRALLGLHENSAGKSVSPVSQSHSGTFQPVPPKIGPIEHEHLCRAARCSQQPPGPACTCSVFGTSGVRQLSGNPGYLPADSTSFFLQNE